MDVIKLGGVESEDAPFLASLGLELASRDLEAKPCVIVHGGGKRISALCESLGLPVTFREGLRVSPPEVAQVVDMVLGSVGSGVVRALERRGVRAVSLRGSDGILRGRPHAQAPALGRVGEVVGVDVELLRAVLATGRIPVLSPLAVGEDGDVLNVNADHAAVAIALALAAEGLAFVSGIPGVLDARALPLEVLARAAGEALIAGGVIHGGMIPKVESAFRARAGGVADVRIRGTFEREGTFAGTCIQ